MRNVFYPGDVAWNEYGHLYSWRMKLREKECNATVTVRHPVTGISYAIVPAHHLTARDWAKIKTRPDMMVQLAHLISARTNGSKVYIDSRCQLNYRPPQQFIKPEYDLTQYQMGDWPYEFLTELDPLSPELQADYPWNMSWQRLLDILTFNAPIVPRTEFKGEDFGTRRPPSPSSSFPVPSVRS